MQGQQASQPQQPQAFQQPQTYGQAAPASWPGQPQPQTQYAASAAPGSWQPAAAPYQQPQQSTAYQQGSAYQQSTACQQPNGYQQPGWQPGPQQSAWQPGYQAAPPIVSSKDHVAAALLAIFLGSLGIHKFYLGYNQAGFIMLAVTVLGSIITFGIAAGVMGVIAIIEGIIYLVKSQSDFERTYVYAQRDWF